MMRKSNELLNYLIKKTTDKRLAWEEISYVDYKVDCKVYEDFIKTKGECNADLIFALRATATPTNIAAATVNIAINVCRANINGLDLYMLEEVDYSMSFPRRNYSLRLIRMDTENKRKSFNQLITDEGNATSFLLSRLAAMAFNTPIDEEVNADNFITALIDSDKDC